MEETIEMIDIFKNKPETPQCSDDKAYGKCLVWTKNEGWRIEK